jgi:outer membrane protein TolC
VKAEKAGKRGRIMTRPNGLPIAAWLSLLCLAGRPVVSHSTEPAPTSITYYSAQQPPAQEEVLPAPAAMLAAVIEPHAAAPLTGGWSVEVLIKEVLARNPSLEQMTAAWQAAAARYPQVTSLDDPMLGLTVAPASIGSSEVDFGGRIEVSQKLPWPGKLCLKGQAALAEAGAAGADVEDMRLQLVESARNAFYEYYLVGRALAVNEEALRLLREFRQNAERRYTTALAPQQDVLQADVELGRQHERQVSLQRMRQVAVARINMLLHLPPDNPQPPPPEQLEPGAPLPPVSALRAIALGRRPDLKALADRLASAESAVALARREYLPDFEVTAAYDSIMGNGPTRDLAPQVGVRVNLPVRLDRRRAALMEACARAAQRRAELAGRADQVNFQVQEAYEQVVESDKVVRLYEETILPAARRNVREAQSAYVTGKTPFVSLIEAQRNLVGLRDRSYEARAESLRRRATLERVTGGPLAPAPDGPTFAGQEPSPATPPASSPANGHGAHPTASPP